MIQKSRNRKDRSPKIFFDSYPYNEGGVLFGLLLEFDVAAEVPAEADFR